MDGVSTVLFQSKVHLNLGGIGLLYHMSAPRKIYRDIKDGWGEHCPVPKYGAFESGR